MPQRVYFAIDGTSYDKLVESLNVNITHTYVGEIKRTQTGKVSSFPNSYRTVGLSFTMLGDVNDLTAILNVLQKPKCTLTFTDDVYNCSKGKFSCTEAKIDRLKDRQDRMGRLSAQMVSIGIPIISPGVAPSNIVMIVAPDN